MIYNPSMGYDDLSDLRASCKIVANIIHHKYLAPHADPKFRRLLFPCPWGRFPFREVTAKIVGGSPTLREVDRWQAHVGKLVRKGTA